MRIGIAVAMVASLAIPLSAEPQQKVVSRNDAPENGRSAGPAALQSSPGQYRDKGMAFNLYLRIVRAGIGRRFGSIEASRWTL